jgi:hypothetical protein
MRALEAQSDTRTISVESVICGLLELDEEGVTDVLQQECMRVVDLWQQHYARFGVKFTAENAIALGFLQGVTFAAAASELHDEQADTAQ